MTIGVGAAPEPMLQIVMGRPGDYAEQAKAVRFGTVLAAGTKRPIPRCGAAPGLGA